jgi:hypothetical protein
MQNRKTIGQLAFERHSKQTIREWLRQLRYFIIKRAWGGHAGDGDEFQVAFHLVPTRPAQIKLDNLV